MEAAITLIRLQHCTTNIDAA